MSKRRKAKKSQAGYPTLGQFKQERRQLLKGLAGSAFYLGLGGTLVACLGEPDGGRGGGSSGDAGTSIDTGFLNPDGDRDAGHDATQDTYRWDHGGPTTPDGGRETGPDYGEETGPDATEVDTGPDWGIAGGMPEPEHTTVRLPTTGFTEIYLPSNDYVSFSVAFVTYDLTFGQYFRDNEAVGINAVVQVLCAYSADDLNDEATRNDVELEIAAALNAVYEENEGAYYSGAETVDLHIEDSYSYHDIDGDIAEPSFPFACE